jgi:hypothetical protein
MDKIPRKKKRATAKTVPAILLFMTREKVHKVRRIRDERNRVLKKEGGQNNPGRFRYRKKKDGNKR